MRLLLFYMLFITCCHSALAQWTIDPIPGKPTYQKPVAEDTLQVKDFYNSKYSVRVGNSDVSVVGRDTILIEPLRTEAKLKRLPQLKTDVELLQQKVSYPQAERIGGVQGVCLAYLKINRKGDIDSVWIEQGLTHTMDSMIVAAVKSLGRFKPARNKGKAVDAICYYRIRFKLFE